MPTSIVGKNLLLQAILPGGSDMHFALFEDVECTVEITDVDRVAYTGWANSIDGETRQSTGPITWDAVTTEVVVRGVGWFDAASGGNLIGFGPVGSLLNPDEEEITIEVGDSAEVATGDLKVQIKDAT